MHTYIKCRGEPNLWTVGHYTPEGVWISMIDFNNQQAAAEYVNYLNGGQKK